MSHGPAEPAGRATVPIFWVDAFTDRRFGGNPAAVCLLTGPADEQWMQGLATELGLSETAYVWPAAGGRASGPAGELSLRWFTPTTEVDLCGHATLATAHALRQAGRAGDGDVLVFRTRSGRLTARFDGHVVELDLPTTRPVPVDRPPALPASWPVAAVAEYGGSLVVELDGADAVRAAVVDVPAIAALAYRVVVVTARGPAPVAPMDQADQADQATGPMPPADPPPADPPPADYVLRVFGPNVGIDEDPVTGSAQCVLGPYWADRLGRTVLQAEQLSARGGRLRVEVDGDRVRVAGSAVTVLAGHVEGPV
ncbi:MAG TPA: PhzF family phenazine biosynthesis protein [Acidimicrobiales bacterium]